MGSSMGACTSGCKSPRSRRGAECLASTAHVRTSSHQQTEEIALAFAPSTPGARGVCISVQEVKTLCSEAVTSPKQARRGCLIASDILDANGAVLIKAAGVRSARRLGVGVADSAHSRHCGWCFGRATVQLDS